MTGPERRALEPFLESDHRLANLAEHLVGVIEILAARPGTSDSDQHDAQAATAGARLGIAAVRQAAAAVRAHLALPRANHQ